MTTGYFSKFSTKFILILIVVLALFMRLWQIEKVPPSLSLDEVSLGYNAYSILKTGADEYGEKFPLILRAYDDWRPALYVYLVIPFVKFFGLRALAVRLPAVILGTLAVLASYFLTTALLPKSGLFTALFLALSPWHIYLSRLGHEVNAGLSFLIFGLSFFFYKKYFPAVIFLSLSFLSYQSEKIIVPLFALLLLILFWKELYEKKKEVLSACLLVMPILAVFIIGSLSPQGLIRFKATNVFEAEQQKFSQRAIKLYEAKQNNDLIGQIFNNRRFVALEIVVSQYLSHFNPRWLLENRGAEYHKVPNLGLLYWWEGLPAVLGFILLIKSKIEKRIKLFIIFWVFVSPIPASITTQAPHAMRFFTFLPLPQFFAAIGLSALLSLFGKIKQTVMIVLFPLIIVLSMILFYNNYFQIFPREQSSSFSFAMTQAISYVLTNQNQYPKIVFSNKENLYQSYMFFLFYAKYDPFLYQQKGGTFSGGYARNHRIDQFEFRPIVWDNENKQVKTLYIGNRDDFPLDWPNQKVFANLDGKPAVRVVSN